MKILIPYLYQFQSKYPDYNVKVLKRGTSYFNVTIQRQSDKATVSFRDVLNYTSPCNLDSYLRQWGAKCTKSIWPHGFFDSIEAIKSYENFPPKSAFYNTLKQVDVNDDDYRSAKNEFEKRKFLPNSHPLHIKTMACWLSHYNSLDVEPLVEALTNSFKKFHDLFSIDANMELSLPTIAFKAMFRLSDQNLPQCVTFDKKHDHLRVLHRQNVIGGLSSVYHRHIDLTGSSNSPKNSRIAPNGQKFSHVVMLDFNSMYLYSQEQNLPCGPGIEWALKGNIFKKSVMISQISFPQIQWLQCMQESDICIDSNDNRMQIQHAYFRDEIVINGYKPDGFMVRDGVNVFFEFLGEFYM